MAKIFLVGMMGVGKTSAAKKWGAKYGLEVFDLDKMIEAREEMPVSDVFAHKGEAYFRSLEAETLRSFATRDNFILATGGGAPCFHNNMAWMNANGTTIWLNEASHVLASRLQKGKERRPLIKNLDDAALQNYVEDKLKERETFYAQARHLLSGKDISHENFKTILYT